MRNQGEGEGEEARHGVMECWLRKRREIKGRNGKTEWRDLGKGKSKGS